MTLKDSLAHLGTSPTDAEWATISERSASDRSWYFVVISTGIVCAPGCPARSPHRERVRIVASVGEAVRAGARACLRCRPTEAAWLARTPRSGLPTATVMPEPSRVVSAITDRLAAAVEAGAAAPSDRELAAEAGVSERRLRLLFREVLGVTPRSWVAARRAETLRARLSGGGGGVLSAVFDAGYESASTAYEAASGDLGMPPARYRAGGEGIGIRWTLAPIPNGLAIVAATDRGLCAVRLGDQAESLEAELRCEFPRAGIVRDDLGLASVASLVSDLAFGQPRPEASTLPLDVHATAFRRRVWEALRAIPRGETRSYTQVAAAVGAPGAARAVGAACAANPVAIVVPCHRVVGVDGSLHGYAYGLERKRQLLDSERPARDLRGLPKQRSSRVREVKSCQAPLQTSVSDH